MKELEKIIEIVFNGCGVSKITSPIKHRLAQIILDWHNKKVKDITEEADIWMLKYNKVAEELDNMKQGYIKPTENKELGKIADSCMYDFPKSYSNSQILAFQKGIDKIWSKMKSAGYIKKSGIELDEEKLEGILLDFFVEAILVYIGEDEDYSDFKKEIKECNIDSYPYFKNYLKNKAKTIAETKDKVVK